MISNTHRFHGRSSLRFVHQRGQVVRGQLISLRYARNNRQLAYRAAIVVSRKVSKSAVVRNRIRRRLYEIVRKHADKIVQPYDMVISVYSDEVANLSHAKLEKTVLGQLTKAGILSGAAQPVVNRDTISQKETNT